MVQFNTSKLASVRSACIGAIFLYSFSGWWGYLGGLTLAVYLMAITLTISYIASLILNPGRVFASRSLSTTSLSLRMSGSSPMHLSLVDHILRERTDLLLITMMACIGGGVVSLQRFRPLNNRLYIKHGVQTSYQQSYEIVYSSRCRSFLHSLLCYRIPSIPVSRL